MKSMSSREIREKFVEYFRQKDHEKVASSPLVLAGDATLLFANAGMNQFKNAFLGLEKRRSKRAVSVQKCVRAGGKHNDLENVGFTARHHTFFEMLGNFSFGDYFKQDAIRFAWDFLTRELQIPKDRLYVTVHISDDEAAQIWQEQENIPAERIFRFGEDNFWRMGEVGPCGPCSEIFYDHTPDGKLPTSEEFEAQTDRFVEIWNLVFMQFLEDENGRQPLPNPSIDTGSGLERVAAVMQGQSNNYDTDLFLPIIEVLAKTSDLKIDLSSATNSPSHAETMASLRVMADHARSACFLMADGVLPSNEGRGYVLRRILRRALRYGRKLSTDKSLLPVAGQKVIDQMSEFYPELKQKEKLILTNLKDEEARFLQTLDQGTRILGDELKKLGKQKTLPGELVFRLYDTYGFPVDLTQLMASEHGFLVDEAEFERHMEAARAKARQSWKGSAISANQAHLVELIQGHPATHFTGDPSLRGQGKVLALSNGEASVEKLVAGDKGLLISDQTVFYAEGGGQTGDRGELRWPEGHAEVLDCTKEGEVFIHHLEVHKGELSSGLSLEMLVNTRERRQTAANHSATHLLHHALREALGDHIGQAGSLVEPLRLRFDFTHSQPLSPSEISAIEKRVNEWIGEASESSVKVTDPKTAIEKEGALALFGEKYGDEVRVIRLGPSVELCGGTHVGNTSLIRAFVIVAESGVSSGIRRIEALTGDAALTYLNKHRHENLAARETAGVQVSWMGDLENAEQNDNPVGQAYQLARQEIKDLKKEISRLKSSKVGVDELIAGASEFESEGKSGKWVAARIAMEDRRLLREVADKIRDKIQSGVVVLIGEGDGSSPILVSVSKDLAPKVHAGQILKGLAAAMGGKGGGKPDFAQGAVSQVEAAESAFAQALADLS